MQELGDFLLCLIGDHELNILIAGTLIVSTHGRQAFLKEETGFTREFGGLSPCS